MPNTTNNHEEAADAAFDERDALGLKDQLDALEDGPEKINIVNSTLLNCLMLVVNKHEDKDIDENNQKFALAVISHIGKYYAGFIGHTEDETLDHNLTDYNISLYQRNLNQMGRGPAAAIIQNLRNQMSRVSVQRLPGIHLD